MYEGQEWETLREWLDSKEADEGLNNAARRKLWDVLQDENLYQNFAGIILSPPPCDDPQVHLARSYRALQVLLKDLDVTSKGMPRQNVLVTETQAGLLTKQVLNSLDKPNGVLIHKRCLLDALLDAYPDKVISSASAGGQDGLEAHLRPLMNPITCHQTLPTLTMLVIYGCTGKKGQASAERTAQVAHMERYTNKPQVKEGHRRKFIKVLSDWGFLSKLAQCIVEEAETETSIGLGEEACESILTIVEVIGYPDAMEAETDERELVDESKLLSPLGQGDWWDPLMSIVASQNSINDASRIAAARTIVGIFGLATGHSTRVLSARAPIADATEKMEGVDSSKVEKEVDSHAPKDNKLREWGLATKIHFSLVSHVPELLKALSIPKSDDDAKTTVYIHRGEDPEEAPESAVPHPGRCRIVPFTSWRLQVVTLLAELLSFVDDDDDEGKKSPRVVAMDAFMKLPLPPSFEGDRGTAIDKNNGCALNPWPTLCEWVFAYPENSLYHVQFLRLFRSICLEHHEATLRLVLQKAKFVARAIRSCSGPLKGITMDCMNILRLRCESLPPRAFLRHFLESHDLWKNFRENLESMTEEQLKADEKDSGIHLGSTYASKMGFDGFVGYKAPLVKIPFVSSSVATSPKKKKKSKNKRKKKSASAKASASASADDSDGDAEAPATIAPKVVTPNTEDGDVELATDEDIGRSAIVSSFVTNSAGGDDDEEELEA